MFLERLKQNSPAAGEGRRWIFVPYDQLNDAIGPLARLAPSDAAIIMVETEWKGRRRPYHRQKLAWVLANQRHFALEQALRGVHVRYVFSREPYGETLRRELTELGTTATVAMPAERELRVDLQSLVDDGLLSFEDHDGWITTPDDFDALGEAPWRMDQFYRQVRQRTGILMEDGSPAGGRYSFDGDNRERWEGSPAPPSPPLFEVDDIKAEVATLIDSKFADHPGELDMTRVSATRQEAEAHWRWVLEECMENFGPYEDAMSSSEPFLFHTLISPLLNNGRLLPRRVVADVEALDIPLNSKEGFIRQVIGWREFVRHVHERTDGFRNIEGTSLAASPGSGGYERWAERSWESPPGQVGDGGGAPNELDAREPLPPAFWGARSGLNCLDTVVADVWRTAYSHHITRLMILSNIATLLGLDPRELTDWFWVAYFDAYDWVVEPNVLGMGTFAAGEVMTTKPYVSGSNYIDKMSDYCGDCAFDPKKNCPLRVAYWAFLEKNRDRLADNNRMGRALWSLDRRSPEKKRADAAEVEALLTVLRAGEVFTTE